MNTMIALLLPVVGIGCISVLAYYVIKKAVKDALREYYDEKYIR